MSTGRIIIIASQRNYLSTFMFQCVPLASRYDSVCISVCLHSTVVSKKLPPQGGASRNPERLMRRPSDQCARLSLSLANGCIRFCDRLVVHPRGSALGVPDSSSSWIALLYDTSGRRHALFRVAGQGHRLLQAPAFRYTLYRGSLGRIWNWTG